MSPEDFSPEGMDFPSQNEHPFSGEDVPRRTPPPRKSGGGLLAVLSHVIPVVLGGVTVFGVYFLFLEDLLKKPKEPAPAETPATERSVEDQEPVNELPPALIEPARETSEPIAGDPIPPGDEPEPIPAESPAEREVKAENALNLARQMARHKPAVSEKWFRKVIEDHPGTKAADEAQAWLKENAKP